MTSVEEADGVSTVSYTHLDVYKRQVRPAGVDTPEKMAKLKEDRLERLLELDLPFQKIGIAHLTCGLRCV